MRSVLKLESRRKDLIVMIANYQQLNPTLDRIRHFQSQVTHLRRVETNPENYRLSASGFLAEIDRMQLEVRDYHSVLPEVPVASA